MTKAGFRAAILVPAACVALTPIARRSETAEPAGGPAAGGTVVLNMDSPWRSFIWWKPMAVSPASDAPAEPGIHPFSHPPAEGWREPDFDDSGWISSPGPFFPSPGIGGPQTLALLCLRGKFNISDPASAKTLRISAAFRGGIAVCLNGKEIARAFLPEGPLAPDSPAEVYPIEVYTTPEGKAITGGWGDPDKYKDRWLQRIRRLPDIKPPPGLLRKGVNVLAVEIHRSPTRKEAVDLKGTQGWSGAWNHAGLDDLRVEADGGGIEPNTSRPKGIRLWNVNVLAAVFDKADWGDPCEPLRPIRIVGTRNGTFSGQVVVGSDGPISGLAAEVSPLKLKGGDASIPSDKVRVSFAMPGGGEKWKPSRRGVRNPQRFDDLAAAPREGAEVQPVWATVSVPPDAAPGLYEGALMVKANGLEQTRVPIELKVCGWKLPDPRDFRTHVGLVQSPDSVALHYRVPLWSEEHWKLIAESLKLLGQVGNKTAFIPLIRRTNFGNEESMVRWVRKEGGAHSRDYSIVDRYLDLYEKHVGKPDVVCFYVWELYAGGGYFGAKGAQTKPVSVTVLEDGGKVGSMDSPLFGTPEGEEFWKPVFDELRERLAKRGLSDDNFMIGVAGDTRPGKAVADFFLKIAPWAKWVLHSHGAANRLYDSPVGYLSHVWGVKFAPDPDAPDRYTKQSRYYGWRQEFRKTVFPREGAGAILPPLHGDAPLGTYRMIGEGMLVADYRGFGRVGADFWDVPIGDKGARRNIVGMYVNWAQLNLTTSTGAVLAPGPQGAIPTARFEMMREGIQECEARIFIERALLDKDLRAKLGDEKAGRFQAMLDERTRLFRTACHTSWDWYAASGWQERAERLYSAAAEIQAIAK